MIHVLGAQRQIDSSQHGARVPENLSFACRLDEQSRSTRGRAKNAKPEKTGPWQDCSGCKCLTVTLVLKALNMFTRCLECAAVILVLT